MFNFKRQFNRYGRTFTAVVEATEGYYDSETGEYVPPGEETEEAMTGIIAQMNNDELRYDEGGTYTFDDRKILIDTDKYTLKRGQQVIIEGDTYQVDQIAPYGLYSHFMKAYVKRVST
ncbi:hypothetical protein SAMN05192534_12365 [Alteribacillus persepolensis]|uniref:Uncharacterized protein n=1 Tax=Alteribacillus persepolensis TaxID=568899 RepID=A0A1G8IAL6_9BACI|nr:hypothetical protein [Alteribacillus persepolensis]SDI15923.1 hypothetical protein SAMN05192534_12365 [Alteribacillus persepolensis]